MCWQNKIRGPNPNRAQKSNIGLSPEAQMWKYCTLIWLAMKKKRKPHTTSYPSDQMKRQIAKRREQAFKLIIARYFVQHWKSLLYHPSLSFTFLSSPQALSEAAKQLSRSGLALSNEHIFSFIAQTFTILFAMYQPAAWQRLPLYHRDISWLFFSFWRLQCCRLEEDTW